MLFRAKVPKTPIKVANKRAKSKKKSQNYGRRKKDPRIKARRGARASTKMEDGRCKKEDGRSKDTPRRGNKLSAQGKALGIEASHHPSPRRGKSFYSENIEKHKKLEKDSY